VCALHKLYYCCDRVHALTRCNKVGGMVCDTVDCVNHSIIMAVIAENWNFVRSA
jgi:hypothetical protein